MAGYTFTREFRKLDRTMPLTIISSDDGYSYPKPMLSNALAKGKTADQIILSDHAKMAQMLDATILINNTVEHIDPDNHRLTLDDGSQHHYHKLVLAVGASPVALPIKGDATNEIISINNLRDYRKFREKLKQVNHIVLIGSGLIGCEFANDLIANTDLRVSVVGRSATPIDTMLPEPMAKQLQYYLAEAGVEWHLQTTTHAINYGDSHVDLVLSSGVTLHADLVVSAIGLQANIQLASQAGLEVNHGIVTNQFLQTTDKDIYALGDCAEVMGHNLLFIAPLLASAKALAKTLTGEKKAIQFPAMPVTIKTPLYPIVVSSPARGAKGKWIIENNDSDYGMKALFVDDDDRLLGFALSGDAIANKQELTKQVPKILS